MGPKDNKNTDFDMDLLFGFDSDNNSYIEEVNAELEALELARANISDCDNSILFRNETASPPIRIPSASTRASESPSIEDNVSKSVQQFEDNIGAPKNSDDYKHIEWLMGKADYKDIDEKEQTTKFECSMPKRPPVNVIYGYKKKQGDAIGKVVQSNLPFERPASIGYFPKNKS